MASYSRVNLLDKMLIYTTVIQDTSKLNQTPLTHISIVNILVAIRKLCERYGNQVQLYGLSLFLRANRRSVGFKLLDKHLKAFELAGFVRLSGGRIYITIAGLNALNDIETNLRTSHLKLKRYDSGKVAAPGPRKGTPKPV